MTTDGVKEERGERGEGKEERKQEGMHLVSLKCIWRGYKEAHRRCCPPQAPLGFQKSGRGPRMFYTLGLTVHQLAARVNTLTSMQHFYNIFGPTPVGRLPGTIKGPFKAIRHYCLKG